jgi:hypothetical protein
MLLTSASYLLPTNIQTHMRVHQQAISRNPQAGWQQQGLTVRVCSTLNHKPPTWSPSSSASRASTSPHPPSLHLVLSRHNQHVVPHKNNTHRQLPSSHEITHRQQQASAAAPEPAASPPPPKTHTRAPTWSPSSSAIRPSTSRLASRSTAGRAASGLTSF